MQFYFDSEYSAQEDRLKTANFDLYINNDDRWKVSLGKRYNRDADDQITSHLEYRINAKWFIRVYERFDLDKGILKEQEYVLTRDLHAWEMDISYNETRGEGSEIWVVYTLKAHPDLAFDFGTSFNKRKAGTQSGE